MHPRIYLAKDAEQTLFARTYAAWLWTSRRAVIAGRAAAALHGARWVDSATPVELIARHGRPQSGITVRQERHGDDEVVNIAGLPVTSVARTAFDLARHLPRNLAVTHLDALSAATGVTFADAAVIADRYPGARGIRRARTALALMDRGSQSPKESWVRMVLLDAGLPRPRTQIRVTGGSNIAFIDLGWDEPMVGIDIERRSVILRVAIDADTSMT